MEPITTATREIKKKAAVSKTLKKILKPSEKKKKQKQVLTNALKKLIGYLTEHCLDLEGICRISGNITKVKELKKSLENEEDVDLSKILDKHTISGALKMFLRDMDEPILSFDLYKNFLGAYDIKDRNAKISFIKSLLSALPKENQEILQMVLKFLYSVQANQEKNKMTAVNIAIVFAPTMLRPKEESFETMMNATNYTTDIVRLMVEEFNVLYEINNTILYKISSETLSGKPVVKSTQELLDEANERINSLLKQADEDAQERAVLETYSHQTYNKLQEEQENLKALQEEKDSLGDLLNELRESGKQQEDKNRQAEEKLQQQRDEIAELKKKLEESNNKLKENDLQLQEFNKLKQQVQIDAERNKKSLDELKKAVDDQKKITEDQKKTIDEQKKNVDDLKKIVDDQKKEMLLKQQQTSNTSDKKEVERLQKDNQDKAKEIKSKNDQIEKLTKERDEANNKSRKSMPASSKEVDDLQKKLKENETKLVQLEKEKEILNETVKTLNEMAKQQTTSTTTSSSSGKERKSPFTIGKRSSKDSKKDTKKDVKETPHLQDEDDVKAVKQFAFSWMILSLKSDAMAHGKNCNISSTDVFDELIEKKIKVNQWTDFVSKKLKEVE